MSLLHLDINYATEHALNNLQLKLSGTVLYNDKRKISAVPVNYDIIFKNTTAMFW